MLGVLAAVGGVISRFFANVLLENELVERLFFDSKNAINHDILKSDKKTLKTLDKLSSESKGHI